MSDLIADAGSRVLSRQARLFDLDAVEPTDAAGRAVTVAAPRIHPVTVTRWTPELTAAYAEQVQRESIAQFEAQAAGLRKRAGGDRHSHYWIAAERALQTAAVLKGMRCCAS